jgi:hypothetical protein
MRPSIANCLHYFSVSRCFPNAPRVSFLVENNVPLPMIRLWIGHGSDRMVHARPEFHANEIAKLPSIANMASDCKQAA